jgi:hypothetical protein
MESKEQVIMDLARGMLKVMRSYNIKEPYPANIEHIQHALDRKYQDHYRPKKRKIQNVEGKLSIVFIINDE